MNEKIKFNKDFIKKCLTEEIAVLAASAAKTLYDFQYENNKYAKSSFLLEKEDLNIAAINCWETLIKNKQSVLPDYMVFSSFRDEFIILMNLKYTEYSGFVERAQKLTKDFAIADAFLDNRASADASARERWNRSKHALTHTLQYGEMPWNMFYDAYIPTYEMIICALARVNDLDNTEALSMMRQHILSHKEKSEILESFES